MKKTNYSVLIHKELSGEITSDESVILNNWLGEDSENSILAENIRGIWIWSQSKVSGWEPDVEGGLSKVMQRIEADQNKQTQQRPSIFRIFKYAAAAIFIFSLGYFVSGVGNPQVEWQIAETEKTETRAISLSDGSQITLNGGTYFTYPETFPSNHRVVKMDGEGFFEISRDEQRPFSIEMDHGTVQVLGTSFNISNDHDTNSTTITVATGKVSFTPKGSSQNFILVANDKLIYNANTQRYRQVKDLSPNDWSWKTKELVFKNTKLKEVIPAIEKHFNIRVNLNNTKLSDCRKLTATFTESPVMDVLNSLKISVGVEIKKAKAADTFVLFGGTCE